MGYKKDVITGISWIGVLRFLTKVVGFVEAVILARILLPEQFGAYGVALLALGLLEVLTETGVNVVLIQEQNVDEYVSSAWVVSILRGIIIMVVLLLASPFVASFFHSQQSLTLLYIIAVVPFLRGFINPAIVKLQKDLLFAKDFWYRFFILLIDTTISISVTLLTRNPIGIVCGLLSGVIIETGLSFVIVSPRPHLAVRKDYMHRLFHRGKWVTGNTIFNYLFFNADNIVVGRLLGAASLGIYQLAYSLSVVPLTELSNVFVHVTFPIFTRLSTDRSRLKSGFLKTMLMVTVLSMPLVLLLVFVPSLFVFALGSKWRGIALVLPILGILGLIKSIFGSSAALFLSEKRQQYATITSLINILGLIIPIIPLVNHYGIQGAATAALIGAVIATPFYLYYIMKIFSLEKSA